MDEDWILNANDGKVAVVAVQEGEESDLEADQDKEDYVNKDVHVYEDAELQTEEEKAFDDYRK